MTTLEQIVAEWERAGAKAPVLFTLDSGGKAPSHTYPGDAGFDLFVSKPIIIHPQVFKDVPTGICIALPAGIWGRIVGRSSTFRKLGLLVIEGVIDNGYRGEIFTGLYNTSGRAVSIAAGERVAQLILHKVEAPEWLRVAELPQSDRGSDGFGSTGR